MIFMVGGNAKKHNNNGKNKNANLKCEYCGKTGHTKESRGKPFCFKYRKDLKKQKNKAEKNEAQDGKDDIDINSLYINCVMTREYEDKNYCQWLGDTGAQCHI